MGETNAAWRFGQFLLFELGALPYAALTSQPTWRAHGSMLADLSGARRGERLLDLGCGPGESAFGIAERVPGLHVTGVDYSAAMIAIARLRQRRDRAGGAVDLTRGDAMALPFADASFHAVTGQSFLYLVPDARRVLCEVRRVLAPGKRCVFLEPADNASIHVLPPALLAELPRRPRFALSLALWRMVSGQKGRFDERSLGALFESAGLSVVELRPALFGMGLHAVAERPPIRSLDDVDWSRWTPADRATLLFVVKEGRVLLILKKRGLGAGKVNGPGGRLEPGETPEAAAVREVQEELGVTPTGVEARGELRFQFTDGYALMAYVFVASDLVGEPVETDEAVPMWTELDRIPYDRMWADDALWLPLVLAGKRVSGRFVFDGERMLGHELAAV